MSKNRLEAFSDGVMAIIITIMVLEMRAPHGDSLTSLRPLLPKFGSYVLSFIYIGIYWNNHHHMLQAVRRINGAVLWANLHLLFWLSLIPFATSWMGENGFATGTVALYGAILLMNGVAYSVLSRTLMASSDDNALLSKAIGKDFKGNVSIALYVAAVALAFAEPRLSLAIYILVAIMWLIPDRRIEQNLVS